jgi:hypothetical protein
VQVLLEKNQPVDIVLDGGWQLTAKVMTVAADHVDLGPIDAPLSLPGQLRWCGATVSWRTRVGAAQSHGVVVPRADGVLRLHPLGDPLRVQRREHVRVPAELSTAVIGGERLLTRTMDVSLGGMLVAPADSLTLEEEVRFALDLGSLTVSGSGRVVRGTAEGARGVCFASLEGGAERALSRFVAQRQRELISAG